jgi:hypothetical protein
LSDAPNPFLLPLVAILRERGVRVLSGCSLNEMVDQIRGGRIVMRELKLVAPVFAYHRTYEDRRMVVGIEHELEAWRPKLLHRGINLLSVSTDGLISNAAAIADKICEHIYRISPENLLEMVASGMPLLAVEAFTGISRHEIPGIVSRFYGRSIQELREEAADAAKQR